MPDLYLPHYKSPTTLLHMHHLTYGIISLLDAISVILFTLLLVHLILPEEGPHDNLGTTFGRPAP